MYFFPKLQKKLQYLRHIPNFLTLCNLFCGIGAVYFSGDFNKAALLILAGGLFDLLDGAVARALKVTSDIGKDLDSLADLVTFGLAPALLYIALPHDTLPWLLIPAFFIAGGSALRLAVFNQKPSSLTFEGLPTPANALFITGLLWGFHNGSLLAAGFMSIPIVYYLVPAASFALLNSGIRFFSLKSIGADRQSKIGAGVVLISLAVFYFLEKQACIWLAMTVYVLYNLILHLLKDKLNKLSGL